MWSKAEPNREKSGRGTPWRAPTKVTLREYSRVAFSMKTTPAPAPDFFLALLDASVSALCAFDARGHFVVCNAAFETLFSIDAAALSGCTEAELRMLLAPRLRDDEAFLMMPESDEAQEIVVEFLDRREKRRRGSLDEFAAPPILLWRSAPMTDISGALCGRLVTQRDITRETQADRAKDDFIAIVSHELRTPMTSIKGYVDLILDGDTGEINTLQREFLTTVRRNTRRLVEMVNDILDISRIEAGGIEFEVRPVLLNEVVTQALEIVAPQANAKNILLETHLPDAVRVLGDFDRILQILTNLLSNAIKYTPSPPASPGLVQIVVEPEGATSARIAVRDSGIGLSGKRPQSFVSKVLSRRQRNGARCRRHRAWPGHHARPDRENGRRPERRQRSRTGQRVFVRAASFGTAPHFGAHRAQRSCAGCAASTRGR